MNEKEAWEFLSQIPVGTIVSWIILVVIIITFFGMLIIKLYKLFEKTKKIQDENNDFKNLVNKHEDALNLIISELGTIRDEQKDSKRRELKKLRHSIVRAGEEAISKDSITIRELRSLEELYTTYSEFKDDDGKLANGYVHTLMNKVRKLQVIGRLDENNEDYQNYDW